MEQLNLFDAVLSTEQEFFEHIKPDLEAVLKRNGAPAEFLELCQRENYYSVVFYGNLLFYYVFNSKRRRFTFPIRYAQLVPDSYGKKVVKEGRCECIFELGDNSFAHASFLADVLDRAIDSSPKSFGCCSRYVECSEAGQCVHPDAAFSMECMYKTNLKRGRIFYGSKARL